MRMPRELRAFASGLCIAGLTVACGGYAETPAKQEMATQEASPQVTAALIDARAAIKEARSVDGLWRDTEDTLASAEEAAKAGDNAKALALANEVKDQAELGVNQSYLAKALFLINQAQSGGGKLSPAQQEKVNAAWEAYQAHEGSKAYDLISAM